MTQVDPLSVEAQLALASVASRGGDRVYLDAARYEEATAVAARVVNDAPGTRFARAVLAAAHAGRAACREALAGERPGPRCRP